jgi:hypothetical protein
MTEYGFIITRHVNSDTTNKYWNRCVKLIRYFYPLRKIIIIDDNSDYEFVKAYEEYKDITVIQSEFPKRGELLPFIYFLRHKWFQSAVIVHDSLFIHKRISFERFAFPVIPLWHHPYDSENVGNIIRITSHLTNNRRLLLKLQTNEHSMNFMNRDKFNLCFGCQCFIQLRFLERLEQKYSITNLTSAVHNRPDRCALERVMGLLFHQEYPALITVRSMFGNIMKHHQAFHYNYDQYENDRNNKQIKHRFIKVWTGR